MTDGHGGRPSANVGRDVGMDRGRDPRPYMDLGGGS